MSRLTEAAHKLGVAVDTSLAGSWVTIRGKHGRAFIAETSGRSHFFVWCDAPDDRAVEHVDDPDKAILAALRRVERTSQAQDDGSDGSSK